VASSDNIHISAKGGQGETGQFEMLHAPGNSNNGDAEQEAKNNVKESNPQAGDQQPDYIQEAVEASGQFPFINSESAAKRPEAKRADLDQLKTKWDPYDGDHHGKSPQKISYSGGQSAEQKPDQVAKKIHRSLMFLLQYKKNKKATSGGRWLNVF
jgi:hypothetical protein